MASIRLPLTLRLSLPEISDLPFFPLPSASSIAATTTSTSNLWSRAINDISSTDLEKLHVLGSGNFGTVYQVRHKITSQFYALKMVNGDPDPTATRQFLREMQILPVCCPVPRYIRKVASCDVEILMEYMEGGTLESLRGAVSESQLARLARQILKGLSYLHAKKIVHRDIKPANLHLSSKKEVKIADFGVSKIMVRSLDTYNYFVGTCAYMSPERIDPNTCEDGNGDSDIYVGDKWSFGLTILELYMGYFPLLAAGERPDWATLMYAICNSEPPEVPDGASKKLRSFVKC